MQAENPHTALDPRVRAAHLMAMIPIRDHNPATRRPYVTYALIAINVAIFAATLPLYADDRALMAFYDGYAIIPADISTGSRWAGLFTSMFLHGGLMHLAGNMLFLFIFGDNLEDEMGHGGFLAFYLASGIGAALAQAFSAPWSEVPMVGASGAIAGVMGGYLLLFPKARVDVLIILVIFFKVLPVPAWIMLGVWFGLQLFNGVGTDAAAAGVAYWAHAGGFVVGLALTVPIWLKLGGPNYWQRTHGHPPHPDARYHLARTDIPKSGRIRNPWAR
jgi:membrane associated rhomboid family serine protease